MARRTLSDGIKRFDCKTHEYGKRAPGGMLLGYIIDMAPREIETEVNGYKRKYLPDFPDLRFEFEEVPPFQTCQEITRGNVEPVQFELVHLWVDLRESVYVPASAREEKVKKNYIERP
jgi:hypothetical protein